VRIQWEFARWHEVWIGVFLNWRWAEIELKSGWGRCLNVLDSIYAYILFISFNNKHFEVHVSKPPRIPVLPGVGGVVVDYAGHSRCPDRSTCITRRQVEWILVNSPSELFISVISREFFVNYRWLVVNYLWTACEFSWILFELSMNSLWVLVHVLWIIDDISWIVFEFWRIITEFL
jgi:hypothetical protein